MSVSSMVFKVFELSCAFFHNSEIGTVVIPHRWVAVLALSLLCFFLTMRWSRVTVSLSLSFHCSVIF
jgi:hypothetical protein